MTALRPGSRDPAVVLLSGGMDSATALAIARSRGHRPILPLTLYYGQRHAREVASARALARHFRVRDPIVLRIPLAPLAPSALTRKGRALPRDRTLSVRETRIPSTYVPARNTVFLSLALALAESTRATAIFLGVNALDYSGYPDCRPEYLRAFRRLASLATARGVTGKGTPSIEAPLLSMTKADIVRAGERLSVPWHLTWSCYSGGSRPCGRCDSCRLRARGFAEAGVPDTLLDRKKR